MIKNIVVSAVVSGIIAFVIAFLYSATAVQNVENNGSMPSNNNQKSVLPAKTPLVVSKDDVSDLSIETSYRYFFEENNLKCYGQNSSRENSPCLATVVFNRNGEAKKIIEFNGVDPVTKKSFAEKTVWKGKMTNAKFVELAAFIVESDLFKNWDESVDLYASNCTIAVKHPKGERRVLSNFDKTATAYLPFVESFIKFDREINWEKVEAESFSQPAIVD